MLGTIVSERKRKGMFGKKVRKGLWTDPRRKMTACLRFKSLLESRRLIIHSEPLVKELKEFVRADKSFAAKPGRHDDLVSGCLLCTRVLDLVMNLSSNAEDMKEIIGDDEDDMPPILV